MNDFLPPAANSDTPPGSFFVRHWRGDVPLVKSFWLTGVALTMIFAVVGVLSLQLVMLRAHSPTRMVVLGALVGISLIVAILWQWVGVWRSAGKHHLRGGKRSTGTLTIVAIGVAGFALTIASFVYNRSVLNTLSKTEATTRIPPYYLSLSDTGAALYVCGGMRNGLTHDVQTWLDKNPGVKAVVLNGPGGRGIEAEQLAVVLRSRQLTTVVYSQCMSACPIAFLGGATRYIAPDARLGFHASSSSFIDGAYRNLLQDTERVQMKSSGLPDEFVNRVLNTPFNTVWVPTPQELLAANVIDAVLLPNEMIQRFGKGDCEAHSD